MVIQVQCGSRLHLRVLSDDFLLVQVYFLWVTRTQKHFEWMVDIIRDVEDSDPNHLMSTHIFITQFYSKFDLRTIMLVS